MSTEEPTLSRAEKKAQRDAARRKKTNKKRKISDVGGDDEPVEQQDDESSVANAVADANSEVIASSKKSKKVKQSSTGGEAKIPGESRSERRERKSLDGVATSATDGAVNGEASASAKTPSKRRKKNDGTSTTTTTEGATADAATDKPSKSRFILFIGNLPFKATDAGLQAHFAKLSPFTLRHRTDPQTKRSKGFAFLEFENYDRMKTCLKLYHHSEFDADAVSNGGTGKSTNGKNIRKINVELTAGGGGKAEGRKEKIKVKNTRLEEQRKRRAEVERKEKERKEKKEGGAAKKGQSESKAEPQAVAQEPEQQVDLGGMHPSRMARLNG
jgi:nucleolar protein 6